MSLTWERRPAPEPAGSYWSADGQWAILPEVGGHGWELCTIETDGGLSVWAPYGTVAEAKAEAARVEELGRS